MGRGQTGQVLLSRFFRYISGLAFQWQVQGHKILKCCKPRGFDFNSSHCSILKSSVLSWESKGLGVRRV